MEVVSVINYKGGVGKTTVTANLGAELARRGLKILLIDLDPQCSLTFCFYTPEEYKDKLRSRRTIRHWYDSFVNGLPGADLAGVVVAPKPVNKAIGEDGGLVHLIASDIELLSLDWKLATTLAAGADTDLALFRIQSSLAEAISEPTFGTYDFILIDCPPNFGVLTQSAIVASGHILMPTKADYLSTTGIESLYHNLHQFKASYNAHATRYTPSGPASEVDPRELGVVFTMIQYHYQRPIATHQYYMDRVKELQVPIFRAVVRENVTLFGRPVPRGVPTILREKISSQIYVELMQLATEFLSHFDTKKAAAA